jgi:predicted ArsR family transcriptional regulator
MEEHDRSGDPVDQFLRETIDTVPHLEALLLLWNSRPKQWTTEDMAKRLFVSADAAKEILDDLVRQRLIVADPDGAYRYEEARERDRLLQAVDMTYRRELIRVSRLIHSKPSAAVRAFARAFRFKKEGE